MNRRLLHLAAVGCFAVSCSKQPPTPNVDERVKALEAENARLKAALGPTSGAAPRVERVPKTAARVDISNLKLAIDMFEMDTGSHPNSLEDLVHLPANLQNWKGPYRTRIADDPWGHPYIYNRPAKTRSAPYEILSYGPDGKAGGNDDITDE